MSRCTGSKNLPFIIDIIHDRRFEGILLCSFNSEEFLELFFRNGEPIHVCGNQAGQPVVDAMYELLNRPSSQVEWKQMQVRIAQPNLDADTKGAFLYALKLLIGNGNFYSLEESQADIVNDFFGANFSIQPKPRLALNTEVREMQPEELGAVQIELSIPRVLAPLEPQTKAVESVTQTNSSKYAIETNLLLPPGSHQTQLEELLLEVSRKEQLEALSHIHFTGYVYYRPKANNNPEGSYGLVLFNDGNISDIIYTSGTSGAKQTGTEAYNILAAQTLTPEIYKVELPILKAYRAIVSSEKPQRFPATRENFARIMTAFKQSARDGVVLFYVDKLKLHYFFLFESGVQVGVFGTDSKSGRLQPLAAPLALPTVDAGASIMVMLAHRINNQDNIQIITATQPAKSEEVATSNFYDSSISAPEAVKWNITLSNPLLKQNPTEATTQTPKKDNSNPFIF